MFTTVHSLPGREGFDLNPFQLHPQVGLDDVRSV